VSKEEGKGKRLAKCPQESRRHQERYAWGWGAWAGGSLLAGSKRRCAGAGAARQFSLINDAHAASSGSCALSPALGPPENGREWGAQGAASRCLHSGLARAGRGYLPGAVDQEPGGCGATCNTRGAPARAGTGRTRGCGEELGAAREPRQPRGRHGRAGQVAQAVIGVRDLCPSRLLNPVALQRDGQVEAAGQPERGRTASREREHSGKRERERQRESASQPRALPLCRLPVTKGSEGPGQSRKDLREPTAGRRTPHCLVDRGT
jgi:hypothetical protein